MIILSEQYGYNSPKPIADIGKYKSLLKKEPYKKTIQNGDNPSYCFHINYVHNLDNPYLFETSFFVGVDWIIENELPIYISPKLNESESEVNYIKMLFQALKETTNHQHLKQLCEIYYDKPAIIIEQRQDLLTPLLIIQFLSVLKKIVQKGLKKSYYSVSKNLNARIKGRILVNDTIKKNHFNNKMSYSQCTYEEFGINNIENRILKRAFEFSANYLSNHKGIEFSSVINLVNYINPAFTEVDSNVNFGDFKKIKTNKLFKEYKIALDLANSILKRYGYNISNINSSKVKTPPFWIDMSKLFELYVFAKLKEIFPKSNEVVYHKKVNYLEPDFIINSEDDKYKMVVDAKYKPQYNKGKISTEDIRQISGYARLEKLYDYLEYNREKNIDCLVIYSSQEVNRMNFIDDNFNFEKEDNYVGFYKIGIKLPTIN